MPISFSTAALGDEIEIPTLDGVARVKIPAETQSGKVFRLRGKVSRACEVPVMGLHCHVVVETPINLMIDKRNCCVSLKRSMLPTANATIHAQNRG